LRTSPSTKRLASYSREQQQQWKQKGLLHRQGCKSWLPADAGEPVENKSRYVIQGANNI